MGAEGSIAGRDRLCDVPGRPRSTLPIGKCRIVLLDGHVYAFDEAILKGVCHDPESSSSSYCFCNSEHDSLGCRVLNLRLSAESADTIFRRETQIHHHLWRLTRSQQEQIAQVVFSRVLRSGGCSHASDSVPRFHSGWRVAVVQGKHLQKQEGSGGETVPSDPLSGLLESNGNP